MSASASFKPLRDFLSSEPHPSGQDIDELLVAVWPELDGGGQGGMEPYKLRGRLENVDWESPCLRFEIERHGSIVVGGSTYAEVQHWKVDLDARTAEVQGGSKRQVGVRQESFDTEPLATELAGMIANRREDPLLRWSKAGKAQVKMGDALPQASKQTTDGRRRRLLEGLRERLEPHGWNLTSGGWWEHRSK